MFDATVAGVVVVKILMSGGVSDTFTNGNLSFVILNLTNKAFQFLD